jgi:3-phenylpropionate/cinnamic acid dioxygenase small subunit
MMDIQLLNQAAAYIWQEADMLDHGEFADWLDQWSDDGLYIIPIDPAQTDFANALNYAYDDQTTRKKRVKRLTSGESISTSPQPRTVRQISRFRLLSDEGDVVTVRCAQFLSEFRKDKIRHCTADLTFTLLRHGDSFRIQQKLIRLINSDDALSCIGYIL